MQSYPLWYLQYHIFRLGQSMPSPFICGCSMKESLLLSLWKVIEHCYHLHLDNWTFVMLARMVVFWICWLAALENSMPGVPFFPCGIWILFNSKTHEPMSLVRFHRVMEKTVFQFAQATTARVFMHCQATQFFCSSKMMFLCGWWNIWHSLQRNIRLWCLSNPLWSSPYKSLVDMNKLSCRTHFMVLHIYLWRSHLIRQNQEQLSLPVND